MSIVRRVSVEESAKLWALRNQGEPTKVIAQAVSRLAETIRNIFQARGGVAPPPRKRSLRALSLAERESLSRGLAQGRSYRSIAEELGRSVSTISREVARNGGAHAYRAEPADRRAWSKALRPKACRLLTECRLRQQVMGKLESYWSPEQVSGWLKRRFPDDEAMHVSAETIYRTLFIQSRGALKKELIDQLRSGRAIRRAKRAVETEERRGKIADAVSIRQRPADVEDRAVPGHWEGDLLAGRDNSYIATLVERQSRFTMLVKVDSKHTSIVVPALSRQIRKLPTTLRRSLTWDNGKELADHKALAVATDVEVYFCDPHSPWQRGTNENTNGLLRQYFPKGTDLSQYSQADLNKVAKQLNERPRKTLKFFTPAEKLADVVASIS